MHKSTELRLNRLQTVCVHELFLSCCNCSLLCGITQCCCVMCALLQNILFFMCAGNELFYCMLYLAYFTPGPQGLFTETEIFAVFYASLVSIVQWCINRGVDWAAVPDPEVR